MKWRVLWKKTRPAIWLCGVELPGCASAGETEDEALQNIREAIELYSAVPAQKGGGQ